MYMVTCHMCYCISIQLVEPVCGRGDPTPSIPVLLVSNESGWDILSTLSLTNLTLAPFAPPPATFDPAVIVTLLIAVVTVVLGSYIANTPFDFLRSVVSTNGGPLSIAPPAAVGMACL